jgi:hypothetical protein
MKRLSRVQTLTLAGVLTTLNMVIVLFSFYLPAFELVIILFVPALVSLFYLRVKPKIFIYFFLANAILITLMDFSLSLLYLLPSLITGGVCGLLISKRQNGFSIILILTLVEALLFLLGNYLIFWLVNVDVVDVLANILKSDYVLFKPLILLLIGFTQAILVVLIAKDELRKWNIELIFSSPTRLYYVLSLSLGVLSIIMVPFFLPATLFISVCFLLTALPIIYFAYLNKYVTKVLIFQLVLFILSFYLWTILPAETLLLALYPLVIPSFIVYYLVNFKKQSSILV